jgi:hypothetical protein
MREWGEDGAPGRNYHDGRVRVTAGARFGPVYVLAGAVVSGAVAPEKRPDDRRGRSPLGSRRATTFIADSRSSLAQPHAVLGR